jgi:carbon-monoxide dehydrogenase small subunit
VNSKVIELTVNSDACSVRCVGLTSLAEVLRDQANLTSIKIGCGEGYCGSCVVRVDGEPVVSCLMPAVMCAGRSVETLGESIDFSDLEVRLQRALCGSDAVQCGMCIPGIVMLMSTLIDQGELNAVSDIPAALVGSICRCSGYTRIINAIAQVMQEGDSR